MAVQFETKRDQHEIKLQEVRSGSHDTALKPASFRGSNACEEELHCGRDD